MKARCKICQSGSNYLFSKKIMGKFDIKYFQCPVCDFIQTEDPYWLEESYKSPINHSDTGIISRNVYLADLVAVLIVCFFKRSGTYVDYAGGYGIFTRLMRDRGFNFFWTDPYTKNLFSSGFEWSPTNIKCDGLTTFECFEHLLDPLPEIRKMLDISDNIIFTTQLMPNRDKENWWYLGTQHGQHIAFYSKKTLEYIANFFNLKLYTDNNNIHIFTKQNNFLSIKLAKISRKIFYPLIKKLFSKTKTQADSVANSNKDYI